MNERFTRRNIIIQAVVITFVVLLQIELIRSFNSAIIIGSFIFLSFVIIAKRYELLHFASIFLLLSLNDLWFPEYLKKLPTVSFLIPVLLSLPIVLYFPNKKEQFSWLRKGKLDSFSISVMVITGLLSTVALVLWALWSDKLGIAVEMMKGFSSFPSWTVVLILVPIFALFNAFAEEIVYRGILQEALHKTFKNIPLVLLLQSSAFAIVHFKSGFPNGYLGYSMVFVYGIILGFLRFKTQGMAAPYFSHVLSDLTIGYYMYSKVVG